MKSQYRLWAFVGTLGRYLFQSFVFLNVVLIDEAALHYIELKELLLGHNVLH